MDIVSLIEQGMWTMQITEPDPGSDPGNPEQKRPLVPGRVIETNIAFRVVGTTLECGFKTVVSDPEGVAQNAEVYRLAVIRQLILHPDFGLRQLTPLTHEPARLVNADQVKQLLAVWHDAENRLPCVVFSQPKLPDAAPAFGISKVSALSGLTNVKSGASLNVSISTKAPLPFAAPTETKKREKRSTPASSTPTRKAVEPPYDVARFARYGVAFCRSYVLEDGAFRRFCQLLGLDGEPGDIFVLEPEAFGGGGRVLPLKPSKTRQAETLTQLETEMHEYPRGNGCCKARTRRCAARRSWAASGNRRSRGCKRSGKRRWRKRTRSTPRFRSSSRASVRIRRASNARRTSCASGTRGRWTSCAKPSRRSRRKTPSCGGS